MNSYPLIKKWLGLEVSETVILEHGNSLSETLECDPYVFADELEAKLAEGFEVYATDDGDLGIVACPRDTQVALAIGKQPIKKQTQAEEAIEFIKFLSKLNEQSIPIPNAILSKEANKILEMEK